MTGFDYEPQSQRGRTDDWLTPPWLIEELGPFDLDPCASVNQPWRTAAKHYTIVDDGLKLPWHGRVWLNPPYGREAKVWIRRLALHGNGIALLFARTDTDLFKLCYESADAFLFLTSRLRFHSRDGTKMARGAAPSVLIAYGLSNAARLLEAHIEGVWFDRGISKSNTLDLHGGRHGSSQESTDSGA